MEEHGKDPPPAAIQFGDEAMRLGRVMPVQVKQEGSLQYEVNQTGPESPHW